MVPSLEVQTIKQAEQNSLNMHFDPKLYNTKGTSVQLLFSMEMTVHSTVYEIFIWILHFPRIWSFHMDFYDGDLHIVYH